MYKDSKHGLTWFVLVPLAITGKFINYYRDNAGSALLTSWFLRLEEEQSNFEMIGYSWFVM